MATIEEERLAAFIEELGALSRKYGITLWACSCCEGIHAALKSKTPPISGHYEHLSPTEENDLAEGISWEWERE